MTTATLPYNILDDAAYVPSDKQAEFHTAPETIKLYGGAIGGGKTTALVAEVMTLMWEYAHNEGFIARRDFDDLRRTTYAEFLKWCPDELIYQHHKSEHWIRMHCPQHWGKDCGSLCHFLETKDLGGLKNANLGFAAFDQAEEIGYDAFLWARTRLRLAHIVYRPTLLSANPGPGWVKKIFIEKVRPGVDGEEEKPLECCAGYERCQRGLHRFIPAKAIDNPYLAEGYVADQIENMPTAYARMLIDGNWDVVMNAIYPQLDRAKQLRIPPERTTWGRGAIGVDYGDIHPSAVVAVQQDSVGRYWVRECWAEPGGDVEEIETAARSMKLRYGLRNGRVDPIQDVLAQKLGFDVAKKGPGTRKQRIGFVTKLLNSDALAFDLSGPGVPRLFDEMLAYRYERRETDTLEEDVVVRKDDDRVAALEYAVEALESGGTPMFGGVVAGAGVADKPLYRGLR